MLQTLQTKAQLSPVRTTIHQIRTRSTAKMDSHLHPLQGLYKPNNLKALYYGPNVVKNHLLSVLPKDNSKAFIITGASLATKTPLIRSVEELLGLKHHAGTFSDIKEHAPIAQLDQATDIVRRMRRSIRLSRLGVVHPSIVRKPLLIESTERVANGYCTLQFQRHSVPQSVPPG